MDTLLNGERRLICIRKDGSCEFSNKKVMANIFSLFN